jgi:hypothetical protein
MESVFDIDLIKLQYKIKKALPMLQNLSQIRYIVIVD